MRWTLASYADLRRIYEFLEPVNASAVVQAVRLVAARVRRIPAQPRLGERSPGFADREVRRVLVRGYEIRYEVSGANLVVLRIFHAREDRWRSARVPSRSTRVPSAGNATLRAGSIDRVAP